MKIRDIYNLELDNRSDIFLVKDGNFYRAFEHSAMLFVDNITQYHITKRTYKVINAELVYLGFPQSALPKILLKHSLSVASETSDYLVLHGFSSKRNFEQWKASVNDNSKQEDEANLMMQEKVLPRFEDNHPLHIYKMGFDCMVSIYKVVENFRRGYKYSVGEELKRDAFQLSLVTFRIAQQGKAIEDDALHVQAIELTDVVKLRLRLLTELKQMSIATFARLANQIEYLVCHLKKAKYAVAKSKNQTTH